MKERIACKLMAVVVAEIFIFNLSQIIASKIYYGLLSVIQLPQDELKIEFITVFMSLIGFVVHIVLCVIYMRVMKPSSMSYFKFSGKELCIGLLTGLVINGFISLGAVFGTGMNFGFAHFTLLLIPAFLLVAIQCAAEEVLLRAFVPAFLEENYAWDVIAFVSGVLFIFHHIGNMEYFGFDKYFCLNVFLIGVLEIMITRKTHNIWWAVGFHTAWNFTQEYIFGLPNSGMSSSLAIFSTTNAKTNFFFNEVYGNEGSLLCTCVIVILIIVVLLKDRRKNINEN